MIYATTSSKDGCSLLSFDYQNGSIGVTVQAKGAQYDFEMSFEEWGIVSEFLKGQAAILDK